MASGSPRSDGTGSAAGGVPFSYYFAFLIAIFACSAAASTVYVSSQSSRDARSQARSAAGFTADRASKKLGEQLALIRATAGQLAANPAVGQAATHQAGCALTFSGPGGTAFDHLDVVTPSGATVCSSRARVQGKLSGYAGETWLASAVSGPTFRAPQLDRATGRPAMLYAMPSTDGKVVIAAFADLASLSPALASVYGGPTSPEFMIVTGSKQTVVSRSIEPGASIGASAAGTRAGEARDLNGVKRIYASAAVPGTSWKLFVGEDKAAALAAGGNLRNRQLLIVLSSLTVILLATILVYRRIVGPMKALGVGVKAAVSNYDQPLAVTGPAEVRALTSEINTLTATVNTHEAVRRAKDEAERANEAKSRFLTHMSHELRTPLAAIMGFAELIHRDEADVRRRSWSGYVLDGGRHLLAIVNELLEVSRIEAGKMMLATEPVDAQRAVDDVLDLVAPLGAERGVRLGRTPGTRIARRALADPMRLKQVLLNLVANAIKYNSEGGSVTIDVSETGLGMVSIAVTDTGAGIAPEKLEHLFTPFERLGAEHGSVPGSGLGLVVTKGLVEAMGGSISVTSTIGSGTTFTVELPLADAHGTVPAGGSPATRPATAGDVLYIDDTEENLRLIQGVLRELRPGLTLRTATNGLDGSALAEYQRPDVLLLDLNLPDLAGEEVLRRLRARARTGDVPVIILSADSTSRNINRLLEAGADAYLTKPVNVSQFLDVLDRLLVDPPTRRRRAYAG
ncbi:MAG TPA: ATP-binding protein [Gaiellaceae bacterium]|nr:ATP-binding protein [Gaiellaceae bacterium]